MTNLQPTMENFTGKSSEKTLDLRPEGHEEATRAAAEKKAQVLAAQAQTSNSQPKGMDIKPGGSGFSQVPGINSEPAKGQADVFKLNDHELENPPVQSLESPSDTQAQEAQSQTASQASAAETLDQPQGSMPDQVQKKPGFFARLFGKK